jgi:hypothetical protein
VFLGGIVGAGALVYALVVAPDTRPRVRAFWVVFGCLFIGLCAFGLALLVLGRQEWVDDHQVLSALAILALGIALAVVVLRSTGLWVGHPRQSIGGAIVALGTRITGRSVSVAAKTERSPDSEPEDPARVAEISAQQERDHEMYIIRGHMERGARLIAQIEAVDAENSDPGRFQTIVSAWIASAEANVRRFWPGPSADGFERLPRLSPRKVPWTTEQIETIKVRLSWLRAIARREQPVNPTSNVGWPWDQDDPVASSFAKRLTTPEPNVAKRESPETATLDEPLGVLIARGEALRDALALIRPEGQPYTDEDPVAPQTVRRDAFAALLDEWDACVRDALKTMRLEYQNTYRGRGPDTFVNENDMWVGTRLGFLQTRLEALRLIEGDISRGRGA